jgi:pentatricopeptide repeat protein
MGVLTSVKVCNALMDMYGKCGLVSEVKRIFEELEEKSVVSWTVVLDTVVKWEGLERGREVFHEMPERNAVAWTVMVAGYLGAGFTREVLELLAEMVFRCGHGLNFVTLCSMLSACAQSGNLVVGRWVHVYALKKEMMMGEEASYDDVMVGTALVDMYAKCGNIDSSMNVFRLITTKKKKTQKQRL